MNYIVGIDLGTTNSLIGMMDAGFPVLIADANGERLIPSVVYISGDGETLVGSAAARMRVLEPASTIYSVKRFIGLRGEDVVTKELDVSYELVRRKGRPLHIRVGNNQYVPEEISALVLRKLKADAEKALGRQVARAVITVPAYFNDAQRNATKRAGELAGFTVERIVNEPTAAALAYGLNRLHERAKIAVYDLGGGTFDLSILELNNGVFQVLSTNGNTRLGGDDIDNRVVDFLVRTVKDCGGPDLKMTNDECQMAGEKPFVIRNLSLISRLREAAEEAKIKLSSETEVEITLPFLTPE